MKILFEDPYIIVCVKPPKVPSQQDPTGDEDMLTMVKKHLIKNYPKAQNPYVGLIHRLDRPVGGVMVFGKTKEATAQLNLQMQNKLFKKKYIAVTCGQFENQEGTLEHYLFRDASKNVSKVVSSTKKGSKKAVLVYKVLELLKDDDYGPLTLLEIELLTGRHHQIRVQCSHEGFPLWGDTKYNPIFNTVKGWYQIALWSYYLEFKHPKTGKTVSFKGLPEEAVPFINFNKINQL